MTWNRWYVFTLLFSAAIGWHVTSHNPNFWLALLLGGGWYESFNRAIGRY